LNHPQEDPYLLLESLALGQPFSWPVDYGSGLWVEAIRRRIDDAHHQELRHDLAGKWSGFVMFVGPRAKESRTKLLRIMDPGLRNAAAGYERSINEAIARLNVNASREVELERRTAVPPPLARGLRERSLPGRLRAVRSGDEPASPWPDGMAALPDGFAPVRVERSVPFTIAVSLSRQLDPVGEVAGGGYWIHLSRDGGASWEKPLYTGLLHYFPYVVEPDSRMPLWSGGQITVEVAIQEVDPASITYPPVGLASRRKASHRYLEIPVAALQLDRDRDGVADIVEERLLLDPDRADSDRDGLEDGCDPLPNVKNTELSADRNYVAVILNHILNEEEDAIVEPVDRGPDSWLQRERSPSPGTSRPLPVRGHPADFSGVRLATPMPRRFILQRDDGRAVLNALEPGLV
jgi:hypothetical protein